MKTSPFAVVSFIAIVAFPLNHAAAQATAQPASESALTTASISISSSSSPSEASTSVAGQDQVVPNRGDTMRPFSAVGVDIKFGVGGIGFDVATPLAPKLNLRGGASFFSYTVNNLSEDGFNIDGTLTFRSVNASVDWYPLHNGFRISPGVTLYNGNRFSGNATVPAGGTITLNDTDYISSPTDPLVANFTNQNNRFGNAIAPSITTGWGDIVPRAHGSHWSVPFEIGFQYISPPKVLLSLTGTACNSEGCGSVQTDPTTQANVLAQQNIINGDIYQLRFYPIVSTGVGYRF